MKKQIIVFRVPQDQKYIQEQILNQGAIVPIAFPTIQVSIGFQARPKAIALQPLPNNFSKTMRLLHQI